MNKLYILICAIVLSGCGKLPSIVEYDKADKYCDSFKARAYVGVLNNKLYCMKNLELFDIPKESLK